MIKRFLVAALFSIAAVPAFAACSSPVVVKDGGGSNVSMSAATGADGNCQSKIDWDTGSQAHADMIAAVPGLPATAFNTNTYTNGTVSPVNMDPNGGWYVNLSRYTTAGGGLKILVTPDSVPLPANQSVNVSQIAATTTSVGNGTSDPGTQRVAIASNNTAFPVNAQPTANATGGATPKHAVAANSTNATSVKGSAGTLYGGQLGNINATIPYYLKLYDVSGTPTCNTDTVVKTILIPPGNGGNNFNLGSVGVAFSTGIGYCTTLNIADNDNTAVPATTVIVNLDWK